MTEMATNAHYLVEGDSLRHAMRLVETYETFHAYPKESAREGLIVGWLRRLGNEGISRGEGLTLLRADLTRRMAALRAKIFMQDAERLGAPRIAVLLHLALVMGERRVIEWDDLWADLARGDYETATDHLLLSEWPSLVGDTQKERERAVALQRILRTGVMPARAAA